MSRTLVILNPHAGGGRALRVWQTIEPLLRQHFGELLIGITQSPQDISLYLEKANDEGIQLAIIIGGDGTNHAVVNALQTAIETYPALRNLAITQIPMGTGRDFSRTVGIPLDYIAAVDWITQAQPQFIDLGHLRYDDQQCYFLNIASAGIGGDVDRRVNSVRRRYPWTYKWATIRAFLSYLPPSVKITLDGEVWYEGKMWITAVANGRAFGHGMEIAPDAAIDDGQFDVVLVEDMPRVKALNALNSVYTGAHIQHPEVHIQRARHLRIESQDQPLALDLDGEHSQGQSLEFTIKPAILSMMLHPTMLKKG